MIPAERQTPGAEPKSGGGRRRSARSPGRDRRCGQARARAVSEGDPSPGGRDHFPSGGSGHDALSGTARPIRSVDLPRAGHGERGARRSGLELVRELFLDAVGQHIGEHQHVDMALVVSFDVRGPILPETGDHLLGREFQVFVQHLRHAGESPMGIGPAQEGRDRVGVGVPFFARRVELGGVAALGGLDDVRGNEDMVAEQSGQLLSGIFPVEGLDGVADIVLVLQQPLGDLAGVLEPGQGADYEVPGVSDVVLPELAHRHSKAMGGFREHHARLRRLRVGHLLRKARPQGQGKYGEYRHQSYDRLFHIDLL